MAITIRTHRFELTIEGLSIFLRIAGREMYWNPIH